MNKIQSCISLIDKALEAYLVPEEEVTKMVLKPSKDFPTDGSLTLSRSHSLSFEGNGSNQENS